jgi:alkylhydroperoxidase family enzyme
MLAPDLQQALRARMARLGYLGEFFQCAGHQPAILLPFMQMTEALKQALPDRLTELGALTVATLMGNDYERHQHERLACKLGFGADWVAAVERVAPDEAGALSEAERAAQRLVAGLVRRHGRGVAAELAVAIGLIGVDQTVALLFLAGRYMMHAVMVNALGLLPPVPSIFDRAEQKVA